MLKQKQLYWILGIVMVSLATIFFVKNDAWLYQVPVGRIERTEKISRSKQVDNFNNQDYIVKQKLHIRILNGFQKNRMMTVNNEYSKSQAFDVKYQPGQSVILHYNYRHQRVIGATIKDLKRDVPLTILIVLAVGLLLLMRWTGVRALLSLALNTVLFFIAVEIDVRQEGFGILGIFSVTAAIFCAITLGLVLGWNKKMLVSFITTMAGTFGAVLIGLLVFKLTNNGGLHFETMEYVTQNPEPLFLAETVLGSLGAVMDESTDIIVSLAKLRKENPTISMKQLWISGRNIGKTIMGPLLNVLFMIFMSDTFAMMALYLRNGNGWGYSFEMNMELGFVQSLISGIGIVLTVPIASGLVGVFFKKGAKQVG
jgi:uncharacterized membrane protein